MAEVIPQITVDSSKVKNTWVQSEVVTNEVYNAINKAVIDLKNNNNLIDTNSMLFREAYNSSSKNLNNAIHQGIYSFTSSAVNAPSGVTGGNLLVTNTSKTNQGSSIITQIAFCHNGAVYARTKNASENFTSWNKLAYITDTVARATSDENGQQITTTYLNRARGSVSGDFNNATTEGIYTFGNSQQNRPFDYGRLLVLNSQLSGTGADTYWIWQLAFQTYGGNLMLRNKTNTEEWTSWRTIPFTDSPAFTGTPTAPTPSTSDNSTKISTTAFVNNYAPSKTGAGASGTWGINIDGNAQNDSQGQKITTTYLNRDRSNTAEDFNNITTEGIYNFGASQQNRPFDYGRLLVLNTQLSGTGTNYWLWQLAFATNGGNLKLRSKTNVNDWTDWRTIPFSDSPAFTGTPTAPTPSTSDNSTRVATTAFVKSLFTASKSTNGWHKEASTGIIYQWGEWNIQSISASASTNVTFPISFPNKCLFVIPSVYNAAEDQIGYLNVTQTGCSFKKGVNDDTIGRNGLYLVIGY